MEDDLKTKMVATQKKTIEETPQKSVDNNKSWFLSNSWGWLSFLRFFFLFTLYAALSKTK
jgi:hypothetical protein